MPYVLLRQDLNPDVFAAKASKDLDFMAFLTGSKHPAPPSAVRIELAEESEKPSDFLETPYFVVSEAMRKALVEFGIDNIEYIPAVLHRPDTGKEFPGYWLGNVIGLVSCVDAAASQYEEFSGGKKVLVAFAVDEPAARGIPLFRLQENRLLVLISEKLRDHLKSRKLEGIYFQETLKYDGQPASSFWED